MRVCVRVYVLCVRVCVRSCVRVCVRAYVREGLSMGGLMCCHAFQCDAVCCNML